MPRPIDLHRPWGRMRVWESGEGPAVLAVHGLGGSGRYWDRFAGALGSHRILAPDLAGFGISDAPAIDPVRNLHLEDLAGVLDALAPGEEPIVLGHSLGGVLVAMLVAREPGRARALGVVASPFPGDDDLDYRQVHAEAPSWRRRTVRALRFAWPVLTGPVAVATRFPYAVVRDYGRQSFRARVWTMWSVLSDPSAAAELRPLRDHANPALVLTALDDTAVPAEDRRRWGETLPGAEQRILDSGGHQLLLRTDFAPLASWVRRVSAG